MAPSDWIVQWIITSRVGMGRLSSLGETYKREEVAQAASRAIGVSALLRPDVLIEIDAVAALRDDPAASRGQLDI